MYPTAVLRAEIRTADRGAGESPCPWLLCASSQAAPPSASEDSEGLILHDDARCYS
jgi:hypothetical protein